jgi:cysteine desulfurase
MSRIYLDHAATTPLRPEAAEAMQRGFELWANPSSPHAEGRAARAALEDARARVKTALGWGGEVIFTSGASEALAIGLGRAKGGQRWLSPFEHDAVFRAAPDAKLLRSRGPILDFDALAGALATGRRPIVAVQHINSETGNWQPIDLVADQVHAADGLLLCDCAQSAGKEALPDADMLVVSAHKLGGPIGIGALLVKDFAVLEPAGGQERGYRSGTENLPAALGFAAALEAPNQLNSDYSNQFDEALFDLANAVADAGGQMIDGGGAASMFIRAISMPGISANAQLIRFDAAGFAVSAGSACSSGSLKPSRVLLAMGVPEDVASRTIRMSIGWSSTVEEIEAFTRAWLQIAASARASA